MNRIQLVVFDIAGTTVHDEGNVAKAFMDAMEKYDCTIVEEEVNKVMGFKKPVAIEMMLQKFYPATLNQHPGVIEKIYNAFLEGMIDYYTHTKALEPLPYATEVFEWLHSNGIKVALNTGFPVDITNILLRRLNWQANGTIDEVISSDEVENGRPHPDMIQELMRRTNVNDASAVAKVGDTMVDIQEGRNAGCGMVISVTTGAYSHEDLRAFNPDHIINSLSEIKELIS